MSLLAHADKAVVHFNTIRNLLHWVKTTIANLRLRTKLLLCFGAILLLNAAIGTMNLIVIRDLGALVNTMYDKALMSGTFAQSAKYDFAKLDVEVRSALLANSETDFKKHRDEAERAEDTLIEDLQVVEQRALSPKSTELVRDAQSAIKTTKLLETALLSKKATTLSQSRFDLLTDWSRNSSRNEVERGLNFLTDDAAETGYRFRLNSDRENQRTRQLSAWLFGMSLVLSLVITVGFTFILLRPIKRFMRTCGFIREGDYATRVQLKQLDEFGELATAFNSMLETIEQKNNDMHSLLNALPFGLFYFDRDGHISRERSTTTTRMFAGFDSIATIENFMEQFTQANASSVGEARQVVVDEVIPFEAAVGLLPQQLLIAHAQRRSIVNLSYHEQRRSDQVIDRIIVVAEDVTARIDAQIENEQAEERVRRISYASRNQQGFKEFQVSVVTAFDDIESALRTSDSVDFDELMRRLHSLKGLLGMHQFSRTAQQIHALETDLLALRAESLEGVINSIDSLEFRQQLAERLVSLHEQCTALASEVSEVLGFTVDENLRQYDERKIRALATEVVHKQDRSLMRLVRDLDRYSIKLVLAGYKSYCQSLCEKFGDRAVLLQFDDASDEILYEEARVFEIALIHILRNAIDHGIESFDERQSLGKAHNGTITIGFKHGPDKSLEFIIEDDGRGINAQALAAKAVSTGHWSLKQAEQATDLEMLRLIFATGLSTKAEASEISGRGVGMDAVLNSITQLGGAIEVTSKTGLGTKFKITLPALDDYGVTCETQAAS